MDEETREGPIRIESKNIAATAISDIGILRGENQDAIYLDKSGSFFLLADGMGGHERGAEASRMIIDVLKSYFKPDKLESELKDITAVEGIPTEVNGLFALIDMGIRDANKVVFEKNRDEGLERYMGSTLVGFILTENLYVIWFNVGDSRLYRFRDGTLSQLTEDHSAYTEWLNRGRIGEEPSKSIITRAVGPKEGVIPDMNWEKGKKGDIYFLCSDGLHDQVSDDEISDIIARSDPKDKIAVNLLNAALDAGGDDNISVIVCKLF